jgi:hypothetical protein
MIARRVSAHGESSADAPGDAGATDDLVHVDDIAAVIAG